MVSGGLSVFRPGEDGSANDVFQRADERMYDEKHLLKSLGAVTSDDESDRAQEAEVNTQQSIVKVKRRVLIVDDAQLNRELLGTALGSGYELIFAADGYEALEQIRTHKDDLGLILLDLMMPRLNGMDVLKTMKKDEDIRDIPVIVMTADQNDWDAPMDAVAVDVNNFHAINEQYGKASGNRLLRSIGERLRTLSRELGGVGSRQGEDTFLMYCPHREDYQELLTRLSENFTVDESSREPVRLRMGVSTQRITLSGGTRKECAQRNHIWGNDGRCAREKCRMVSGQDSPGLTFRSNWQSCWGFRFPSPSAAA